MSRVASTIGALLIMAGLNAQSALAQTKSAKPVGTVVVHAPQGALQAMARKLNLGAPRSDTPAPRATKSGTAKRLDGWYQCFERGCVYYSSVTGVRAVHGTIFKKFVAEGAEHKTLGFPTSDEQPCRTPSGMRYQTFEGGRLIWQSSNNIAARVPSPGSGDPADCTAADGISAITTTTAELQPVPARVEAVPAGTRELDILPGAPAKPPSGQYRVTLNGFLVGHETWDHAGQVDGKRDEVYIVAESAEFDGAGEVQDRKSPVSIVMGDIQDQTGRMNVGGASDLGGLRSSDQFPVREPWRINSEVNDRRPPMLLWEGTLTRGSRAVVIVPTIWEWDGPTDLLTQYRRGMTSAFARYVRRLNASESNFAAFLAPMTGGPGTSRPVGFEPTGNAADRPIGISMRPGYFASAHEDQMGAEWFTPQRLLLTYDLAEQAVVNTRHGFGPGIFTITYSDHPDLAGVYTLYVQVSRID